MIYIYNYILHIYIYYTHIYISYVIYITSFRFRAMGLVVPVREHVWYMKPLQVYMPSTKMMQPAFCW